jgi:hypothetical protein
MIPRITGQMIVRNKGEKDGRTLCMIVGILAVPKDQEWQDGHQYTLGGDTNDTLSIDCATPINRHLETIGYDANMLLTSPLWRV